MTKVWGQSWAGSGPSLQDRCLVFAAVVIATVVILTKMVTLTMSENKYNHNLPPAYVTLCTVLVSYCCHFHALD